MITEAAAERLGLAVSRCPFNVQLTLADCSKASRLITHWTHDVALSALNQSLVTLPTLYVVPSVPGAVMCCCQDRTCFRRTLWNCPRQRFSGQTLGWAAAPGPDP